MDSGRNGCKENNKYFNDVKEINMKTSIQGRPRKNQAQQLSSQLLVTMMMMTMIMMKTSVQGRPWRIQAQPLSRLCTTLVGTSNSVPYSNIHDLYNCFQSLSFVSFVHNHIELPIK